MLKSFVVFTILSVSFFAQAANESPYSGQQLREIKSLSQSEIEGYLSGQGMGFAKAAELNHYPGPRHVLDIANELKLNNNQRQQTQALFDDMQARAIKLGEQLVKQERELDQLFAQGNVKQQSLENILQEIGAIRAKLRFVHLSTHLEQKNILTRHQIMMYDQIRGYDTNGHGGGHAGQHSH